MLNEARSRRTTRNTHGGRLQPYLLLGGCFLIIFCIGAVFLLPIILVFFITAFMPLLANAATSFLLTSLICWNLYRYNVLDTTTAADGMPPTYSGRGATSVDLHLTNPVLDTELGDLETDGTEASES